MNRWIAAAVLLAVAAGSAGGCGSGSDQTAVKQNPQPAKKPATTKHKPKAGDAGPRAKSQRGNLPDEPLPGAKQPKTFADLLKDPPDAATPRADDVPPAERPTVDDAAAATAGIRKLVGKHLTLYTDVPSSPAVDELPRVFDAAVPQWCAYFRIDPQKVADWHVRGSLIKDKVKFAEVGLFPADLPRFLHGFARKFNVWVHEQPTDYYRRHLLLHEGTHAIMNTVFGGAGPPWYMEGVAELLATHSWDGKKLTLNQFPKNRDDVPGWGRIKLVRDDVAEGKGLPLMQVLAYDRTAHLQNAAYGWSWAAAAFLDGHPRYQARFRELHKEVRRFDDDFNVHFREVYKDDLPALLEEWQAFVAGVEYGHDLPRAVIDFASGKLLPASGAKVTVAADRGWQNSGWRLSAGTKYRFRASGRYQIADRPMIWWSEPNGVSIRHYAGQPLGMLFAAVRPDNRASGELSVFLRPLALGLGGEITPPQDGTLYFRINDSPAELADNKGTLMVEVKP